MANLPEYPVGSTDLRLKLIERVVREVHPGFSFEQRASIAKRIFDTGAYIADGDAQLAPLDDTNALAAARRVDARTCARIGELYAGRFSGNEQVVARLRSLGVTPAALLLNDAEDDDLFPSPPEAAE